MAKQEEIAEMLRQEVEIDLIESLENAGVSVVETPIGEKEWEWDQGHATISVHDDETGNTTRYRYKVNVVFVKCEDGEGEDDESDYVDCTDDE